MADDDSLALWLAGDVMTGRGIDQVLQHPGDPALHQAHVHDARDYVRLAEAVNGPIPAPVPDEHPWGDALATMARHADAPRIVNLETAITRAGEPWPGKGVHYRMHPANIGCLRAARLDAVAQLKQGRYFHKQADWLLSRFPDAALVAVPVLVKLVDQDLLFPI